MIAQYFLYKSFVDEVKTTLYKIEERRIGK